MLNPLVTIIIVTWNGRKYLPFCLESIYNQTFKDFSVIIIDNASTDSSVEFVRKKYPEITILKNPKNLGFCRANNQGIELSNSQYLLLCNQDIILEQNFLAEAVATIEQDEKIANVGPKLLKAKWDAEELSKPLKTDIIDSCGFEILKSHRVYEIGQDEVDRGQRNQLKEVFGISGALVLFKKEALDNIKQDNQYFDENFFSYKEDVDLAWRLRLAGYKSIYNPNILAYHFRAAAGLSDLSDIGTIKNRAKKSKFINYHSYKNHLLTIIKNQTATNLLLYSPFIFWYEFKKFIYLLFFEPQTLSALTRFLKQLPAALKKRQATLSRKKVTNQEIRRWFK